MRSVNQYKEEENNIFSKRIKQVLFFIAMAYLIWSIFVTILSVFTTDEIDCKYLQCNLLKIFNKEYIDNINNISLQMNGTNLFGECYYKGEKIDCNNIHINIFNRTP